MLSVVTFIIIVGSMCFLCDQEVGVVDPVVRQSDEDTLETD